MEDLLWVEDSNTGYLPRLRARLGIARRSQETGVLGTFPSRLTGVALPPIRALASELCAQRGLLVRAPGELPHGGTILCVEDLSFERAIVLLSLFDDARVYLQRGSSLPRVSARTLSIRTTGEKWTSGLMESVVGDLSHGRVVVMSSAHYAAIRKDGAIRAETRRARVDKLSANEALVLVEN